MYAHVSVPSELINTVSSPAGTTVRQESLPNSYKYNNANGFRPDSCWRSTCVCVVWSIISSSAHLWMRWECSYSDTFTIGYNYTAVQSCWGYLGCVSCSGTGEEEDGSLSALERCWVPALKSSSDVSGLVKLPSRSLALSLSLSLSPPAGLHCTQEDITPPLRTNTPGFVCVI